MPRFLRPVPMTTFETRVQLGLRRKKLEKSIEFLVIILFGIMIMVIALYLQIKYG